MLNLENLQEFFREMNLKGDILIAIEVVNRVKKELRTEVWLK